jgi:hypothetical protein
MLHLFLDDKPWFAPKRFGYGAGLPIAWQGWAVLAAHVATIVGVSQAMLPNTMASIGLTLLVALLPLPLYAAKTRGGWKWRNGSEAD